MMFDDEEPIINSVQHRWKHRLFGIFVCTGMAHLVLTTFDVPNISYIRIFLVGAMYVYLGITIKMGQERPIYLAIFAGTFSMITSLIEFLITGSHFTATMLIMFDGIVFFMILNYLRVKDAPMPEGVHRDDLGLKQARRMEIALAKEATQAPINQSAS